MPDFEQVACEDCIHHGKIEESICSAPTLKQFMWKTGEWRPLSADVCRNVNTGEEACRHFGAKAPNTEENEHAEHAD